MKKVRLILFLVLGAASWTLAADKGAGSQVQVEVAPASPTNANPPAAVLTLDDVIREGLERNPSVQAAFHQVEAQRRRVPQVRTLPDPTVSTGWAGNITPFSVQNGDPSSSRFVSVSQQLLYPGKLKLRGEVASKEVEAATWDYEAVRRRVVADLKVAYYDYSFQDKAIQTTQRNKELLQKLASIAEARYRVGKGVQQDVLKSQVEISLLLQKLTVLEQQKKTAQVRLNTLLARDPESPLPPAADLPVPEMAISLEALYAQARAADPLLQREQTLVQRSNVAISLAKRDYYPDFTVGYMYQQRPDMPDMNGFTFGVNIPIFYKTKQREAVRQAAEERISAERSRDNRQNELNFELKQQYLAAQASSQLLRLYSEGVVPQSSLALESSMSAYQVGNVDFLTVIGNFTTLLNYQVDYYRELANFDSALARIEALVGVDPTVAKATTDVQTEKR
ncbi:MAG TPA: TolC family protein [Terriglobales bacterium]|nr:TolC family protein [Terriglobales bacterium]